MHTNNMGRDFEGNVGTTTINIGKYYSRYHPLTGGSTNSFHFVRTMYTEEI